MYLLFAARYQRLRLEYRRSACFYKRLPITYQRSDPHYQRIVSLVPLKIKK